MNIVTSMSGNKIWYTLNIFGLFISVNFMAQNLIIRRENFRNAVTNRAPFSHTPTASHNNEDKISQWQ